MNRITDKHFALLVWLVTAIVLVVISFLTRGNYGGTDNFNHYFLALSAWHEPRYFLDSWGRPLYTSLSAPFALLGYEAVKLFNVALGLLTGWFAYLTARRLGAKQAWIAILFVCFTPIFLVTLYTALTEILFSFVVVLSVYFFFRERYLFSALVISFLPFARTEGYMLIPFFGLALLMRRQWKAIPWLAFGFLFFCAIGSFHHKDFFWPVTKFPYPVSHGHEIYKETGSLWHFLINRDFIIGLPLEVLFLGGLVLIVQRSFSRDPETATNNRMLLVIVAGPFLAYFGLHSILWWKAMGGSMGLVRVMAAVMPLAALVAVFSYDYLAGLLNQRWLRALLAVVVIFFMVKSAVDIHDIPLQPDPEQATMKQAADWLRGSGYNDRPFYFTCLDFPFYYKINPNDPAACKCAWFFYTKNLDPLPSGSVLIWDAHFGPNENQVPLDSILLRRDFRLLNVFRPEEEWISYGGRPFEVYIVQKVEAGISFNNRTILDSLNRVDANRYKLIKEYCYDFDTDHPGFDVSHFSTDQASSGVRSLKVEGSMEFTPGIHQTGAALGNHEHGLRLYATLMVYSPTPFTANPTDLVVSAEEKGEAYYYRSLPLESLNLEPGRWHRVSLGAQLPRMRSEEDVIKVYLWHRGKEILYMDDLSLEVRSR